MDGGGQAMEVSHRQRAGPRLLGRPLPPARLSRAPPRPLVPHARTRQVKKRMKVLKPVLKTF